MKKKGLKLLIGGILITTMVGTLVGCGGSSDNGKVTISVSGSTSVAPLMEKIAEEYEKENKDISIEINQVGSSAGIKDTINGVAELGMSSRDLSDKEKEEGIDATEIAYDGIAVIVNTKNKVKNLTLEQLKDIYTGKITNWKEVGGDDIEIVVVSREDGSGTRGAFQEIVGYESKDLISDATITDASGNLITTVAQNENAIGFVSFSYIDDTIKAIDIDGVSPEAQAAKDGTYKISRPFLIVTKKDKLSEEGQKIIDYILSEEGQKIVAEDKLITLE